MVSTVELLLELGLSVSLWSDEAAFLLKIPGSSEVDYLRQFHGCFNVVKYWVSENNLIFGAAIQTDMCMNRLIGLWRNLAAFLFETWCSKIVDDVVDVQVVINIRLDLRIIKRLFNHSSLVANHRCVVANFSQLITCFAELFAEIRSNTRIWYNSERDRYAAVMQLNYLRQQRRVVMRHCREFTLQKLTLPAVVISAILNRHLFIVLAIVFFIIVREQPN